MTPQGMSGDRIMVTLDATVNSLPTTPGSHGIIRDDPLGAPRLNAEQPSSACSSRSSKFAAVTARHFLAELACMATPAMEASARAHAATI